MPLSRMPPRAVSVTASWTPSSASARAGAATARSSPPPRRARRRGRRRRCWTSRPRSPLVRAMWAIIRLVVVLPLVPVTATTGILRRDRRGPVAALGGGHLGGGRADGRLDVGRGQRVEGVRDGRAQRARPVAVAPREGDDEHLRVGRRAVRAPRGARVPASLAMARTRRSTARSAKRCRKPDPGAPGRVVRSPMRRARRSTASSSASPMAETSSVSFTAARGK